jgi:hypothetical protein
MLVALAGMLVAARGRAVPLTVYGQLPGIEDVAISPDGSRLAYVRTQGDTRVIFVANVADQKLIRYVKAGETKLRDIEWADRDNLIITTSVTAGMYGFKDERFLLRVYNVPRNELRSLPGDTLGEKNQVMNTVLGAVTVRRVDGHTVLFVPGLYMAAPDDSMADSSNVVALFRCDLTTGLTTLLRNGPSASWLLDTGGHIVAEEEYDERTQRWSISTASTGGDPSKCGPSPIRRLTACGSTLI